MIAGAGGAVLIAVILGLVASSGFPSAAPAETSTVTSVTSITTASTVTATSTAGSSVSSLSGQSHTSETSSTASVTSSTLSTALPSTITMSVTSSTITTSTTLPCGSPGVYCGGVQLTSGSLVVNGNSSVLQVTLTETGNSYIGSATVYVNGTAIGVPPAAEYEPPGNIILNAQPGQQAVLVLTIPNSTISIQSGRTYSVMVYTWEGPPGQRASEGSGQSISITAT